MKPWFYADDARERIGPLSADELRAHYGQRRLRRDSLVWCDGMAHWVPLDAVAIELDIDSVTPDAALPPPLPPRAGAPRPAAAGAPRTRMSGCLIALIVSAAVAVPLLGILAAIALPAYNDYLHKAKVMGAVTAVAPLQDAIAAEAARAGVCPGDDSAGIAGVLAQLATHPQIGGIRVGTTGDGRCAFEVSLRGLSPPHDGQTLLFAASADGRWTCSGGDLPAKLRPRHCRTLPDTVPN